MVNTHTHSELTNPTVKNYNLIPAWIQKFLDAGPRVPEKMIKRKQQRIIGDKNTAKVNIKESPLLILNRKKAKNLALFRNRLYRVVMGTDPNRPLSVIPDKKRGKTLAVGIYKYQKPTYRAYKNRIF